MPIPAHYLEKIRSLYPNLTLEHLEFNQDGVSNDVVMINQERVCRFPKSERAKKALMQEAKVLQLVQRYIDTSIRIPQFECLNEECVSYPFIRGEPLSRNRLLKLDVTLQEALLEQFGSFYQQLHAIPIEVIKAAEIFDSPVICSREEMLALYEQVQQTLFPHLWKHQRVWIEEHFEPLITGALDLSYTPTLIHGDLACYHILFDADAQAISGIIDFGTAGIGSPAVDVSGMLDIFGETIVKQMARYYSGIEAVIEQARFGAGTVWLQWALIGMQENRPEFLLAHLGHIVRDLQPFGTPLGSRLIV